MIICSTSEIFKNPWGEIEKESSYPKRTPSKWLEETDYRFEDIRLWEEIFYQPGLIGVYVAWDPYEELYIIVHNLHLTKKYVEIYQGIDAVEEIIDRCKDFGINLDYTLIKQT